MLFDELYEQQYVRVYNLAARVLGDLDEARDVTQDAFIAAFRKMPDLPCDVDMERWMYRVTVNACYDVLRRRRSHGTCSLENLRDVAAPGDGVALAELTRSVETALSRLNVRYRTALVLKDLHGLRDREIADAMGVSHGTARVLLFRARRAFRHEFGKIAPAGAGTAAGLGLAVLLPVLPVPPALQSPPSLAIPLPDGPAASPADIPMPWTDSLAPAAGPIAAGIGAKLGAVVSAKWILVTVTAAALAGGGVVIDNAVDDRVAGDGSSAIVISADADQAPAATGTSTSPERKRHSQRWGDRNESPGDTGARTRAGETGDGQGGRHGTDERSGSGSAGLDGGTGTRYGVSSRTGSGSGGSGTGTSGSAPATPGSGQGGSGSGIAASGSSGAGSNGDGGDGPGGTATGGSAAGGGTASGSVDGTGDAGPH